MAPIDAMQRALGYHQKWIEYGLIDPAALVRQFQQFQADPQPTEHYRYAAFLAILKQASTLADQTVIQYIALATLDPDAAMGQAALGALIEQLTEEQLQRIEGVPAFQPMHLQKLIRRRRLLQAAQGPNLTDDQFERILESNDAVVQRELVERTDLSPTQLSILQQSGRTKAIRNLATVRLKREIE